MNDSFMKEKPVLPLILSMALPMVVSMLVNSLYNIVDSFFVAQISEQAMTALSLVYPVQNLINAVAIGFGVGINAVIAYHLGARQPESASMAATHGTALSALHGLVLTAVCIPLMPWFLGMFTDDRTVIELGSQYAGIAFSFSVVIMVSLSFEKIYQAVGRMKETMLALLSGCITNIVLDPMLIFGIGPFPQMGIRGAALATGIGQVVTLVIYLVIYRTVKLPLRLGRSYLRPNARLDKKLYAIGIPATLNLALPSLLISALNAMLAAFSQAYVVILGIYYKLQTFLYLPASGIIQGMRPLIGYNFGAGEHRQHLRRHPGAVRRHHGGGDGNLLCLCRTADGDVHRQPRDHLAGRNGAAHHQPGLYPFGGVGGLLRRAGGAGQGHPVLCHLAVPLCAGHPAGRLCAQPHLWGGGGLARLLDHRACHGGGLAHRLPQIGAAVAQSVFFTAAFVVSWQQKLLFSRRFPLTKRAGGI